MLLIGLLLSGAFLLIFGVWALPRLTSLQRFLLTSPTTSLPTLSYSKLRVILKVPALLMLSCLHFASTLGTAIFPHPIQIHAACLDHHDHHLQQKQSVHLLRGSFLDHLPFRLLSTRTAKWRASSDDCQALMRMWFWIHDSRTGRVSLLLKSHVRLPKQRGVAHKSLLPTQAKKRSPVSACSTTTPHRSANPEVCPHAVCGFIRNI